MTDVLPTAATAVSGAQLGAGPSAGPMPRPKAPTACMNCRARKLKCSGERPSCTNCPLYGATCEYATSRAKSGPPKGSTRKKKVVEENNKLQHQHTVASAATQADAPQPPPYDPFDIWGSLYNASLPPNFELDPGLSGVVPGVDFSLLHWSPDDTFAGVVPDPSAVMDMSTVFDNAQINGNGVLNGHIGIPTPPPTSHANATPSYAVPTQTHAPPPPPPPAPAEIAQPEYLGGIRVLPLPTHELRQIYRVHCWLPLFPLTVAEAILLACPDAPSGGVSDNDASPRVFCALALRAVVAIAEATQSPNAAPYLPESDPRYIAAQKLAMPCYLTALNRDPAESEGSLVGWDDDRALVAGGLAYLAVREVFVRGWCREAATWLRLSAGVVESLPPTSALRAWFARVVWLWDIAMSLTSTPYGPLRLARAVSPTLAAAVLAQHHATPMGVVGRIGGLEGDARIFDSLVSLVLDLTINSSKENYDGPMRIQQWFDALPPSASQGVLQMVTLPAEHEPAPRIMCDGRPSERQALARVVHLVYYALCTRFHKAAIHSPHVLDVGPERARVRLASIRAAMATIIDTVDWILHTRHYWLWAFAEQGLVFAQNAALSKHEPDCEPQAPTPVADLDATPPLHSAKRKRVDDTGAWAPDRDKIPGVTAPSPGTGMIPEDAPRRGLLLMTQDVLLAALDVFGDAQTHGGALGAGHLPTTRMLLGVAAVALSTGRIESHC